MQGELYIYGYGLMGCAWQCKWACLTFRVQIHHAWFASCYIAPRGFACVCSNQCLLSAGDQLLFFARMSVIGFGLFMGIISVIFYKVWPKPMSTLQQRRCKLLC